jgi:hypothetical protein
LEFVIVIAAQRHRELVARLAHELFGKAQTMGIRRPAATDQASLLRDIPDVIGVDGGVRPIMRIVIEDLRQVGDLDAVFINSEGRRP